MNRSVTHWKSTGRAGLGRGRADGGDQSRGLQRRLDKGPHAGKWIRLAVTDDGVGKRFIGDTEADTRRQMEAESGGPRSSDL